jgi:hypothetical protein
MTTEKYLRRLSWLINTINSRSEQIALDRSRATNMVVPTDNTPVQSSPKDALCEIVSDIADMDEEKKGYIAEYKFIMTQINSLTGVYSPAYIYRRYGRGQSVNEIAREMEISRSTAYRIHRDALAEFEFLYGDFYKAEKNYQFMEHSDTL